MTENENKILFGDLTVTKYIAELPSIIEEDNNTYNAALIVSSDVPKIADAVEILKLLAELPSVLEVGVKFLKTWKKAV